MANPSRRVAVIVNHLKPVNESSIEKQDCLYADFDYTSAALNASTLAKERAKSTFDVNKLNVYLEGGAHKAQVRIQVAPDGITTFPVVAEVHYLNTEN